MSLFLCLFFAVVFVSVLILFCVFVVVLILCCCLCYCVDSVLFLCCVFLMFSLLRRNRLVYSFITRRKAWCTMFHKKLYDVTFH